MNKSKQGKKNRQAGAEENKYSLANKKRWANPEYKKEVSKKISKSMKGNKNLLGHHQTEETKKKIRNSSYHMNLKGTKIGEKNPNWKNGNVGYNRLHTWVNNNFESKNICEICKSNTKKLEWANKDHKYSRKREDWQLLCRSCHRKWDNARKN